MNNRLSELHLQRGRLLERVASQRYQLGQQAQPVCLVLAKTDHVLSSLKRATDYVKQHPSVAGALGIGALFLLRGSRARKWAVRAFAGWQIWRSVSARIQEFSGRAHL